jgi:hypothetical protein
MFIVPIAGDTIKTTDGFSYTVLSFTNYKNDGPAVIAEPDDGSLSETIYFESIVDINGSEVEFSTKGHGIKVFEAPAAFERKFQLPQPNDLIYAKVDVYEEKFKVLELKLHVTNNLSKGLILKVENVDTEKTQELSLNMINDIEHTIFSRTKFLKVYEDYLSKADHESDSEYQ